MRDGSAGYEEELGCWVARDEDGHIVMMGSREFGERVANHPAIAEAFRRYQAGESVFTRTVPAQVGFTKPMMEESVVDRIARLKVEGHRP